MVGEKVPWIPYAGVELDELDGSWSSVNLQCVRISV
jgi:hypothetical protein